MDDDEHSEKIGNELAAPWSEYRRLVLRELARINANMLILERKIDMFETDVRREGEERNGKQDRAIRDLEIAVAMLQVKSGVWGGLAGAVVALGLIIGVLVKGH